MAPGEYLVRLVAPFALPGELRQTTDQSVQAARQQIRSSWGAAVTAPATNATSAAGNQGPTIGYAPVFYPNTSSAAAATLVKIAAGEEHTGIDIQVRLVPTAKIEGIVIGPEGQPVPGVQLSMLANGQSGVSMSSMMSMLGMARPAADGSFTIPAVAPGQYTIAARSAVQGADCRRGRPRWAGRRTEPQPK